MSRGRPALWLPFVRAALATGLSAGFGLGALLFTSLIVSGSTGAWWPAAGQAHGHAQIVGWAGMTVLGVGIHFLPRLASATESPANLVRFAFWVFFPGLTLRVVCQPAASLVDGGWRVDLLKAGWIVGACGELAGAALLVAALATSIRSILPLDPGAAMRPVLPFLVASFLSLLLLLAGSLLATVDAVQHSGALLDSERSRDLALLGFYGFLTTVSVAMSIRLFPLYFRTRPPRTGLALTGLVLLLAGLAIRLLVDVSQIDMLGRLAILVAVVVFAIAVRVFEPRRPLPRRELRIWEDAPGLHAVSAYAWLVVAAIAQLGGQRWLNLELHLLGTGFVLMLILGSGVHLIPGFARQSLRSGRYIWATLAAGSMATVFRAIPAIPDIELSLDAERSLGAAAGVAGMAALGLFAFNLADSLRSNGAGQTQGAGPSATPGGGNSDSSPSR